MESVDNFFWLGVLFWKSPWLGLVFFINFQREFGNRLVKIYVFLRGQEERIAAFKRTCCLGPAIDSEISELISA